jgi:glycosyltransferase involved in cell wall biosynthesis
MNGAVHRSQLEPDVCFSLILATIGRTVEVERFLRSLCEQSYQHFELIVIDQNDDARIPQLIERHQPSFPWQVLRSLPGLSRARNVGLQAELRDVVAFPDDDCWYPKDLLAKVAAQLRANRKLDGLTGRSIDEHARQSSGSFSDKPGAIGLSDVWSKGISYTIFLRSPVCAATGTFDEQLGVGAQTPFGSGEESDYLIRALKRGANIHYDPTICVGHPNKEAEIGPTEIQKAYRYGAGMGRVLAKHNYPTTACVEAVLRPSLGALLALAQLRPSLAHMRMQRALGRVSGMRSSAAR